MSGTAAVFGTNPPPAADNDPPQLKAAKLNIEHNATDLDTGFQGFIDSEGWQRLDVTDPNGELVLSFEGRGELAQLGVTELFFETVEPANADVSIAEMLAKLPEGNYTIAGPSMINGQRGGRTSGIAWLSTILTLRFSMRLEWLEWSLRTFNAAESTTSRQVVTRRIEE